MNTYINTTEGWNIAARYGLKSEKYKKAKEKWEKKRASRVRYWKVRRAHA